VSKQRTEAKETDAPAGDWRESRRRSARAAIVEAAWSLVGEEGLAGLSLRDLARRAGTTTPTLYAYFDSKNDIYDAMFGQAAALFEAHITAPYEEEGDPRALLLAALRRFVAFCTSDVPRYQLLFQRPIPGFEPSPESYAPAVRALDSTRGRLSRSGIPEPRHLDLWTAVNTGLVAQQIANDPGGERWTRLVEEAVDMFIAHCQTPTSTTNKRSSR
jgi:AcrR family transcriptional regulator